MLQENIKTISSADKDLMEIKREKKYIAVQILVSEMIFDWTVVVPVTYGLNLH